MSANTTKTECVTNQKISFVSADTIYITTGAWLSYIQASLANKYDKTGIGCMLGATMVTSGVAAANSNFNNINNVASEFFVGMLEFSVATLTPWKVTAAFIAGSYAFGNVQSRQETSDFLRNNSEHIVKHVSENSLTNMAAASAISAYASICNLYNKAAEVIATNAKYLGIVIINAPANLYNLVFTETPIATQKPTTEVIIIPQKNNDHTSDVSDSLDLIEIHVTSIALQEQEIAGEIANIEEL